MKNNAIYAIVAAVAIAILGLAWFFMLKTQPSGTNPNMVACTMEAKICPDGTAVGRSGPKCEFAACPSSPTSTAPTTPPTNATSTGVNTGWKTLTDRKTGVTFQYPDKLTTTYITASDWPPTVQVQTVPFTCTNAGTETGRAGKTETRMVDNRSYCVTTSSEGAAGSIYNQYAYAFQKGSRTVILTFTVRMVQCGNFDEPQKTACENEREAFDLDGTVDRIAQTLTMK